MKFKLKITSLNGSFDSPLATFEENMKDPDVDGDKIAAAIMSLADTLIEMYMLLNIEIDGSIE